MAIQMKTRSRAVNGRSSPKGALDNINYPYRSFSIIVILSTVLWLTIHSNMLRLLKDHEGKVRKETRSGFLKTGFKTCIALGVYSRNNEYDLRQLHREIFNSVHPNSWGTDVRIQLFFALSSTHNAELKKKLIDEEQENGDTILLDIEEKYERLTERAFSLIEALLPHVAAPECQEGYVVKFDTDVAIGYETLVQAIKAMPSVSVYFGQMIPNMPVGAERVVSEISMSFMPMWTTGLMWGFSRDVANQLLSPGVIRTVFRPENSFIFREEDRALGLAIYRGKLDVRHYLYLEGAFTVCSRQFSCDHYHHATAFHVGAGLSGEGAELYAKKKKALLRFYRNMAGCNLKFDSLPPGETLFFEAKGNKTFEKETAADVLTRGCYKVDPAADGFVNQLQVLHSRAAKEVAITSYRCAEHFYLKSNPGVARLIDFGGFKTGRDHYIREGWKNTSMHFFCPKECEPDNDCLLECDKERVYLESYPDVARAVAAGSYASGFDHFIRQPSEHRSYSCYQRQVDIGGENPSGCLDVFSEFISDASVAVSNWPVHGNKEEYVDESSQCKALIYIDGQNHEWMDFVLRVNRRYTGPDWTFYLIGPPKVAKIWRKKYGGPMVKIVELPEQFGDLSVYPRQYNDLLLSNFLWKEVVTCEYTVVSQADSMLLRHGIEDFFEFAYVGAPVFSENFPSNDWRLLNAKSTLSGGNGGLSFRRRSYMINALDNCPFPMTHDEDVWFSSCMQDLHAPLPHPTIANRFSTGSTCEVDAPLGVHKLWQNCGILSCGLSIISSRLFKDVSILPAAPDRKCTIGEALYRNEYPDVDEAIRLGNLDSAWKHFLSSGKDEGRKYQCFLNPSGSSYRHLQQAFLPASV